MRKQRAFRKLTILGFLFTTLFLVYPAAADTHTQYINEYEGTEIDNYTCGFDIEFHYSGTLLVNSWVDENDQQTKQIAVPRNFNIDYSANGKTVNFKQRGPLIDNITYNSDMIVWDQKISGATFMATVPGYGLFDGYAGNSSVSCVYDLDWNWISCDLIREVGAGENDYDFSPVCEYLSP